MRARFHPLFPLLLALLLPLAANAAEPPPEQILSRLSDQMLATARVEREAIKARPQRLFEIIDKTLGPRVDFPRMARWVLGKYWRRATPEQQNRFIGEFRTLLLRFYGSALLDDPKRLDSLLGQHGEVITFLPTRGVGDAQTATVRSEVHLPNGKVVAVNFSVHDRDGTWKVYDVNVGGISLITNYRNSFAEEVRQYGLDALLDRLAKRNQDLLLKAGGNHSAAVPRIEAVSHPQ